MGTKSGREGQTWRSRKSAIESITDSLAKMSIDLPEELTAHTVPCIVFEQILKSRHLKPCFVYYIKILKKAHKGIPTISTISGSPTIEIRVSRKHAAKKVLRLS